MLGLIPKSTIGLDTEDATTAISGLDLRNQSNIEAQQESLQEIEASPGAMEGNMHRQHYVGESHWDAVLRDVSFAVMKNFIFLYLEEILTCYCVDYSSESLS